MMWHNDFRGEECYGKGIDSFAICSLVRETLPVVQRFVDHYQRAGAERIFLFLDGSEEETQKVNAAFQNDDSVSIECCDEVFWAAALSDNGQITLEDKQAFVFKQGIQRNPCDWMLFCDADDLIVSNRSLGNALAVLPKNILGVRIKNTEAAWGPGDDTHEVFGCGYERHAFPTGFLGRNVLPYLVYGRYGKHMCRGTTGYVAGKHLLRKGVKPETINSHFSRVNGDAVGFAPQNLVNDFDLRTIHFDAIGFDRWREKWQMRATGEARTRGQAPVRLKQQILIQTAIENGQEERVFRRLNTLNHWQAFLLTRLGLLSRTLK